MLDETTPLTPSDGQDASRGGDAILGWWNHDDGIASTSISQPVYGPQLRSDGSAPSITRDFSIDTQLANSIISSRGSKSSEFRDGATQDLEFSPLLDDNESAVYGQTHNHGNSQGAFSDVVDDDADADDQPVWRYEKDEFVPSPTRQSPLSLHDDDVVNEPFAAPPEHNDASNEPSTAEPRPSPPPLPPLEGFSLLEMTGRLHGFVEPNQRRLEGVRRRAAELEGSGPEQWRAAIAQLARMLVQRVDEAVEVNWGLIAEWEALDAQAAKGWSWDGMEGLRRAIASRVACVEMILRLLELLAKEVGWDGWRERVHGAIVDEDWSASCAGWWKEIGSGVGVAAAEGPSKKVDAMQEDLEELLAELDAEQSALQSAVNQRRDTEADEEVRRLLESDDDGSDLSDYDEDVLAPTEDDPLLKEGI